MLVIPAVDILGGNTVRLLRGDYDAVTTYDADPGETLRGFVESGARRVHVVDLDAARGTGENRATIAELVAVEGAVVQVGGGVRRAEDVEALLDAGAAYAVLGTAAAERPGEAAAWSRRWPGKLYIGVDAREGRVATHGWQRSAAWDAVALMDLYRDAPIAGFIYTDIARDGALEGAATDDLARLVERAPHQVLLAGGVTTVVDVVAARQAGAAGVVIGRALYEGRITLPDALAAAA